MHCCALQVGLAGPSGSGKTIFSEKVQHFLPGQLLTAAQSVNATPNLSTSSCMKELVFSVTGIADMHHFYACCLALYRRADAQASEVAVEEP